MAVDAIVNTANPQPVIGSGIDAEVHAKAGPMLLATRKLIGTMNTGEARITPGFRLPAKHVIHTVGPVWIDGDHGETYFLRQCYENALSLAWRNRLKSIAFPLISTGNYGFPPKLALQIAGDVIREFLKKHEMQVYLVVFNRDSFELSGELVDRIRSYIGEAEIQKCQRAGYSFSVSRDFDFGRCQIEAMDEAPIMDVCPYPDTFPTASAPEDFSFIPIRSAEPEVVPSAAEPRKETCAPKADRSPIQVKPSVVRTKKQAAKLDTVELAKMVKQTDAGFTETHLKLIDKSGEKDSDVYKRANVDRRLFSKIRNNPQYKPSKATAIAFAIALELNLEETRDFIGRAGYALSRSNKFDIIIEYFITHGRYDIYEINMMLFEFDQSLLGA